MLAQEVPPPSSRPAAGLAAWLRLAHTPGLGAAGVAALLERFGSAEAVLGAGHGRLTETIGSATWAAALLGPDPRRDELVGAALDWLAGSRAEAAGRAAVPTDTAAVPPGQARFILTLADSAYPARLRHLPDPPTVLYGIGDPAWLSAPQVAIVGSRNATALGARTAAGLARDLAQAGWSVASGLAEGIDRAAHEGALAGTGAEAGAGAGAAGGTVAVMGTGIDRIYPVRHQALADRIAARGAVVTELPVGAPPLPGHFPRRNRLIAALVHAVVVVEAAPRSGSLITARLAAELGREVLAVPGSIHSPLAQGCNDLIRQGAKLVAVVRDILDELPLPAGCQPGLRWPDPAGAPPAAAAALPEPPGPGPAPRLTTAQAALLQALSADPVTVETLAATRDGLPVPGLLAALQTLELFGLVERLPDGSYIRCP